jgi:hypothetical protein
MHLSTKSSKRPKTPDTFRMESQTGIGGNEMENDTKLSTVGVICYVILKLLWYLFLAAAGVLILLIMVLIEASNPKHNKNNC